MILRSENVGHDSTGWAALEFRGGLEQFKPTSSMRYGTAAAFRNSQTIYGKTSQKVNHHFSQGN